MVVAPLQVKTEPKSQVSLYWRREGEKELSWNGLKQSLA